MRHDNAGGDTTRSGQRQRALQACLVVALGVIFASCLPTLAGAARPQTADSLFSAIRAAATSNDLARVRSLTTQFTTRHGADPRVPEVLLVQGTTEKQAGQEAAARRTWQWLLAQYPKTEPAARALEQLILLLDGGRNPGERQQLLARLQAEFPRHPSTVRLLTREAEARAANGDYAGALGLYRRLPAGAATNQEQRVRELVLLNQGGHGTGATPAGTLADQLVRAEQLAALGNLTEATRLYEDIWQRHRSLPPAHEARYRQGGCLRLQQKHVEAVACWQSLLDVSGPSPWKEQALLAIARTQAFELGQYEPAIASYRLFLEQYPKSSRRSEAEYQLAGAFYLQHDYIAAKSRFERFIADYPTAPAAGEASNYLAKCESALQAATLAARQVDEQRRQTAAHRQTPAAVLLSEAEALRQKQDYRHAANLYERLIRIHKTAPEYDTAVEHGAECFLQLDDPRRAVNVLEEFARWKHDSPRTPHALLAAGNVYLEELAQPRPAQACFAQCIALLGRSGGDTNQPPLLPQARYRLGLALFRQGQLAKAKEIFIAERIARGGPNPDAPPTELDRLITACATRRSAAPPGSAGAKLFAAPDALSPIEAQVATADLLFTAKEYAKAVRAYEKAVSAQPGSEAAAYSLMQAGRCYVQQGQTERGLQCYRRFLTEYATSQWADDALIRAGVVYVSLLHQPAQGRRMFEQILERYPNGDQADQALVHLASLASAQGRTQEATEHAQQLLAQFPASPLGEFVRTQLLPRLATRSGTLPVGLTH